MATGEILAVCFYLCIQLLLLLGCLNGEESFSWNTMKQKSSITYGLGVRGEDDEEQHQKKLASSTESSNTVDKLCTTIVLCPPAITNYEIKLNA